MENNLILRVLPSPYNDNTRGSALDHEDVDGNFIYLKGNLIKSGTTQNNNLILQSLNGEVVTIPFNLTGSTTGSTGDFTSISALTFDTNNTITLKDTTGGTFTALINYLSGLTITGSVINGTGITASGIFSHAEGSATTSNGIVSHAEGILTFANGVGSHTEGSGTTTHVNSIGSHAEGLGTVAYGNFQHVSGRYNLTGNTISLAIIGNGTSTSNRSDLVNFNSTGVTVFAPISATTYYGDGSNLTGISKLKFCMTATTAIVANDNELSLISGGTGTLIIPANYLSVGKSFRLTVRGKLSTDPSNPASYNFRLKIGNTTIASTGNSGIGANRTDVNWEIHTEWTCRSIGTGGTVMAMGMFFKEDGPGANGMENTGFAVATVNTTISNTLDFTVDGTDGSAGNSIYAYILIFEEI